MGQFTCWVRCVDIACFMCRQATSLRLGCSLRADTSATRHDSIHLPRLHSSRCPAVSPRLIRLAFITLGIAQLASSEVELSTRTKDMRKVTRAYKAVAESELLVVALFPPASFTTHGEPNGSEAPLIFTGSTMPGVLHHCTGRSIPTMWWYKLVCPVP